MNAGNIFLLGCGNFMLDWKECMLTCHAQMAGQYLGKRLIAHELEEFVLLKIDPFVKVL